MTLKLYQLLGLDPMEPAKRFAEKKMERYLFAEDQFLLDTTGTTT